MLIITENFMQQIGNRQYFKDIYYHEGQIHNRYFKIEGIVKNKHGFTYWAKVKECTLEFDSSTIIPLSETERKIGKRECYKCVEIPHTRAKTFYRVINEVIDGFVYKTKQL